jgi:hypothetical protein
MPISTVCTISDSAFLNAGSAYERRAEILRYQTLVRKYVEPPRPKGYMRRIIASLVQLWPDRPPPG